MGKGFNLFAEQLLLSPSPLFLVIDQQSHESGQAVNFRPDFEEKNDIPEILLL